MNYADPDYFENLYQHDADPWQLASSAYERDKYAATIASLPARRFRRCFEVGCSIGVLTRSLAARCDSLLGVDLSETALQQARARCSDLAHVTLDRMSVPAVWPEGLFDLIVFSEVLYYLGSLGIQDAARRTVASLEPGGTVLLVNWRGETGGACSGDAAAGQFRAAVSSHLGLARTDCTPKYRIDLLA